MGRQRQTWENRDLFVSSYVFPEAGLGCFYEKESEDFRKLEFWKDESLENPEKKKRPSTDLVG